MLVTHDSFVVPDDLIEQFEVESGLQLEVRESGDTGSLTNRLVLTKGSPTGDAVFGIDNTFAGRALSEDVFAPSDVKWAPGSETYALSGDSERMLTPVDNSNVCVNIDDTWFESRELDPPRTLEDLTDTEYEGLFVTPSAASSSPGLAFLLATIAEYGDGWLDYWERLMANGARIASSWTDAFQVDFTQGGGNGNFPIVTSYDSSPPITVPEGSDVSPTSALLDTCFRQVEYAAVLKGADNPEGAAKVIEWLVSDDVQASLPENMYVFPVDQSVSLPRAWSVHAPQPTDPLALDPAEIEENRAGWLEEWTEVTTR